MTDYDSWKLANGPYEDDSTDDADEPQEYEDDPVDASGRRL